MREDLVVDVLTRRDGRPLALASGYLIAPGLVLTARHAVDSAAAVHVRLLSDTRRRLCRIAWRSPAQDVAVLAFAAEQDQVHAAPVARWGLYAGISAANPAETMGFPWAQEAEDGSREVEHLRLLINSGAGWLSGRNQAAVDGPIPVERSGDGSRWAGLSGAAVLAGDLVVGVVVEETPKYGAGRLSVVAVRALVFDTAFRALVEQVAGQAPVAEPAELAAVLTGPARVWPRSPAMLLRADAEVVGFYGREQELAALSAWAEADDDRSGEVRVRLYTGPGGQGKTRLARAFARDLAGSWAIAALADRRDGGGQGERAAFARLASGAERLLVIVDYAETRAGQVLDLLRALAGRAAPTRVLLLARSAGDWWQALGDDLGALAYLADPCHVIALPVLHDSLTARRQAFTHAVTQLRAALKRLPGPGPLDLPAVPEPGRRHDQAGAHPGTDAGDGPPDLRAGRYRTALDTQMAALVAVLGGPAAGGAPEREILRHERRYWKSTAVRRAPNNRVDLHDDVLTRAVTVAALCGASTRTEASRLLPAVPGIAAGDEDLHTRVAVWLHELYPAAGGAYWGSLHPDLLAEHLVAEVIREDPGFLARVLAEPSATQARQALRVLARAALHQPDVAAPLTALIGGRPDLARHAVAVAPQSENPGPLLSALAEAVERMPRRTESLRPLWGLAEALPARSRLLDDLRYRVYRAIVTVHWDTGALRTAADQEAFAAAIANLARHMAVLGRPHDALQGLRLAANYYESFAEQDPGLFLPTLTSVLAELAEQLAKVGERHNATVAIHRALDLGERLAAEEPGTHRLLLASTLSTFACMFPQSRTDEALAAMRRSVALHEQAAGEEDGTRPALAASLCNLVAICAAAGLTGEALTHARRAVDIYEPLAEADPDAHQAGLAGALRHLAVLLAHHGKPDQALDVAERMAPLWKELIAGSYARFGADFLQVTLLLGFLRLEAGRPVDAAAPLTVVIQLGHSGAIALEKDDTTTYQAYRLLRTAYRMEPEGVSAQWSRITGDPAPEWLREEDTDLAEEAGWYRRAAEAGDANAVRRLAELHDRRGETAEATRWYAKAAEAGDTTAMNWLGSLLRRQNRLNEAEPWWRRAAEAGDHTGMTALATLLMIRGELAEAETWSRQSATFGDVRAMNVLGMVLMMRGEPVEAETWLSRAGRAGDVDAANNLLSLIKIKGEIGEDALRDPAPRVISWSL
ncbi:tetratricopeptide repeat protein [Streptosporangium canum]|uniref:tetratricopeptide repeat protein n=1 Tax=Streptosporangium canum TaxID=324952 RepID=UPI0033AE7DD3